MIIRVIKERLGRICMMQWTGGVGVDVEYVSACTDCHVPPRSCRLFVSVMACVPTPSVPNNRFQAHRYSSENGQG